MLKLALLRLKLRFSKDPFNREDFERWVELQPKNSGIGIAGRSVFCPLANYLLFATGKRWHVGRETYYSLDGVTDMNHPRWSWLYVKFVDGHQPDFQVYREETLDFLKTI